MITETIKKEVLKIIKEIKDSDSLEKSFLDNKDFLVSKIEKGEKKFLLVYKEEFEKDTYFVYQQI